ncbi:MAG: MG2 domain-containing protein, partial [bacterium]
MRLRWRRMVWVWSVLSTVLPAVAAAVTVERFTPQGSVKEVRQALAVFAEPMVPFGDLRAVAPPFTVECPVPGSGRWVDTRTWAYDFEQDLPGGMRCAFTLVPGLQSLSEAAAEAKKSGQKTAAGAARATVQADDAVRFEFDTGGPAIDSSQPGDGDERIDAQQAFVLELDGEATRDSVLALAAFAVTGLAQRVGVDVVESPSREAIVDALPKWLKPKEPYLVLQARQTFPDATKVRLIWGAGIASPSGVATDSEQVMEYQTRARFTVEVSCERENAKSHCIPLTPLSLRFSAPVPWAQAKEVRLVAADGSATAPKQPSDPDETVTWLDFAAPFPESASFTVTLPAGLRDDAGRMLAEAAPLTVQMAPYPPLAKFAARFGLLESQADPALPVTIRNLDPTVNGQETRVTHEQPAAWRARLQDLYGRLKGETVRIDKPEEVLPWLRKLAVAKRDRSMFATLQAPEAVTTFTLPQPDGPQAMQVVGLPFSGPGLYLVELASPRLGAALLGVEKPMYVPAGALVTNLAVHLKWGRESSLAWVTTLDEAQPVEGARIVVQQCDGSVVATAVTDAQGIARLSGLPEPDKAMRCDGPDMEDFSGIDYQEYYANRALTQLDSGLLVTAQTSGDLSFVHSSWEQGIESWRFRLPSERYDAPLLAHTIFDRPLYRLGETVHMKYVLRTQTLAGFGTAPQTEWPSKAIVRHLGSDERFELPLHFDANGLAEGEWTVPPAAKLGQYDVRLVQPDNSELGAGEFRVEQFRVPLMKASVQLPAEALVGATAAPVDIAVQYLAGGPAAEQPVIVRAQVRVKTLPSSDAFEDSTFANGPVAVGIEHSSDSDDEEDEPASDKPAPLQKRDVVLDAAGTAHTEITGLPPVEVPRELLVEAEYRDPNGETQTAAATVPLWPSGLVPGIQVARWVGDTEATAPNAAPSLDAQVVVLDTSLHPVAGVTVVVSAFTRTTFSHRKRVVGGFYTYEHVEETKAVGQLCSGKTDARGVFACRAAAP